MTNILRFQPDDKLMYIRCAFAPLFGLLPALATGVTIFVWTHRLPGAFAGAAAVMLLVCGLRIIYVVAHHRTIQYEISEQHVINAEGLFWKMKRSTPLEKVTNVDVRQGPLQRALGIGDVWIFTPSTGAHTPEAALVGIANPNEIRARLLALTEQARSIRTSAATLDVAAADSTASTERVFTDMLATLERIESLLKETRKL